MIPYIKYDADPALYNVYNTTVTRTLDGINHLKCKSTQEFDLDDNVQIVSIGGADVQVSMGIDILDHTTITISASESYIPSVGTPIIFVNTGGSLPSPYVYGTTYYIRELSLFGGTYFGNLSATLGGPAITAVRGGTFTIQFYEDDITTTIFDGIITGKKIEIDNAIYEYEIAEQAYELTYSLVNDSGKYFVKLSSQTVNDIIDNYILSGTGWSRGSSDTTIIPLISFYYSNRLNALYKVIEISKSIGTYADVYIWFDVDTKTVYFDSSRNTNTEPSIVINKTVEESSAKRNIDYVIVLGNTDDIIAQYPTTPAGIKAAIYRYSDATASSECLPIATSLYEELKNPRLIITYEIPPSYDYFEGDIVTIDATDYIVQEVIITTSKTKITLNDTRQTIQDILSDSLKEVTGEIATGATATYDGGLQNIGAPSINKLIECKYSNRLITTTTNYAIANGTPIRFTTSDGGVLPSPLQDLSSTYYYADDVIEYTDGGTYYSFRVTEIPYGDPVTFTSIGSGTIYYATGFGDPISWNPANKVVSLNGYYIYVDNTPDTYYNGLAVVVSNDGGSLPGGLSAETTYYIVKNRLDGCKLAATEGGEPIDITSDGTGINTLTISGTSTSTTFTASSVTNRLIFTNDGQYYNNDNRVLMTTTGTLPSPLNTTTTYYISDATEYGFALSTTEGGNAVSITTNGSGLHRARNLESISVPAVYYINISDQDTIDNFNLNMDFDYYKEGISVADSVEFLNSTPPYINTVTTNNVQIGTHSTYDIILECDAITTGFQFGIINLYLLFYGAGVGESIYTGTATMYVDYGDGIWIDTGFSGVVDGSGLTSTATTKSCAFTRFINGSTIYEPDDGFVRIKITLSRSSSSNVYAYVNYRVDVQRIPRHTHIIDNSYNVSGSIYPSNIIVKLTNSDYTDETLATYSTVTPPNSEKTFDISSYIRTGANKLVFYSDTPGSVYLSGSYDSYR